jgi:hypothetical protein
MGKGEKNVEMPVYFLLINNFFFDQNSVNCRNDSRGHEHYKNIPVPLVQGLDTDDSGANSGQKGAKAIVLISEPSHAALDEPQG